MGLEAFDFSDTFCLPFAPFGLVVLLKSKASRPMSRRPAARSFPQSIRRPRSVAALLEHAAVARDRVAETMAKLAVESEDVRIESERVSADHAAALEGLRRAQAAIEATRIGRVARESELASARIEHEWRARSMRSREQELAGLEARLRRLASGVRSRSRRVQGMPHAPCWHRRTARWGSVARSPTTSTWRVATSAPWRAPVFGQSAPACDRRGARAGGRGISARA